MSRPGINSVFYAESYHPIQAGSIDGTDILPHDNAIYRAHLCSSAGLYEPFRDANVTGDPYCTIFVGRLSHLTTEDTLRKAMSKYGRVKNLRLVRHIVTGASRGYAFVEFSSEREMRRAYEDAHHSLIDDYEIIVDYNRQQLMPGWIPRRLGGGLGGKKESGQLRFGGRERPFRAPLRPIPFDDLKRLGIPPPPEGRYMSRFQVPSPPRRSSKGREEASYRRSSMDREEDSHKRGVSLDLEEHSQSKTTVEREDREERRHRKRSREREREREERHSKRSSRDKTTMEGEGRSSPDREEHGHRKRSRGKEKEEEHGHRKRSRGREREEDYQKRRSRDKDEKSHESSSMDWEEGHNRRQERGGKSHRHENLSSHDYFYDQD